MTTTMGEIDAIWRKQTIACFAAIQDRGRCSNIATVIRDGREVVALLQRGWDDDADMHASWREVGEFAAAMRGDTVALTADTYVMYAAPEEIESSDFVRPRDNPAAQDALVSGAYRANGIVKMYVETLYGRGDDGIPTIREVVRRESEGVDTDSGWALVEGLREGKRADDPLQAIEKMAAQGHVVMYKRKVYKG